MFRRGWRYFRTHYRIINWYVWSFNLVIWTSVLLSLGYHYLYRQTKQQQAVYHYQPARDEIGPARPPSGKPQPQQYDPKCQAPINHEDSDLCAQWSAVEAVNESNGLARINVWLTAIALLMTAGGTSLLIWTLWETRQTARYELRAYISVRKVVIDLIDESGFHGGVEIINLGATPAAIIDIAYRAWIGPGRTIDPAAIGPKPITQALVAKVMGKDHPETIRVWVVPDDQKEVLERMKELTSQKWEAYIYGWVVYDDIFGARHSTRFAYTSPRFYLTKGDEFVPCIGGNMAD